MWRIRKAGRKDRSGGRGAEKQEANPTLDLVVPSNFRCPISLDLMKDPVTLCTGITYDRHSIDTWIDAGNRTCPVTNRPLWSLEQIPNHTIRSMIQDWCVENRSYGIERIPTPRIPISPAELVEILLEIGAASRQRDDRRCLDLVKKINVLGKESERNRRCIVEHETGRVLCVAFDMFAGTVESHARVLEEILLALSWMLPLDDEARNFLRSSASLHCMAWFLKCGNLGGRSAAALALKDVASSGERHIDALARREGLMESLVKVIKEPICPTTTKASLLTIYYMVSMSSPSKEKTVSRFVDLGLVALLLEMLVDSEKSICEKALGVLDGLCSFESGRQVALDHALSVSVLVKKIFRVSETATEFAVSVLWKLCKNYKGEDGGVMVEALRVGAFQKVLLLLQVGCDERTKEKVTDLLKLLNAYRTSAADCIDSMDFKQLKRPF